MIMRWLIVGLVLALLGIAGAVKSKAPGLSAVDSSAAPAHTSQDYRSSVLALQTGWMSFGQLWFAAGR